MRKQRIACYTGALGIASALCVAPARAQYVQTNLVSNSAAYRPQIFDLTFSLLGLGFLYGAWRLRNQKRGLERGTWERV